jgi:Meckel syndrome type 1 protein
MTTIITLPACAAPSAARQPDTTLDPASGDPFAAALAAALTAGLAGAQPAPMALVTLGAPAQTGVSSDDGAAVTDVSLAAGSQTSEATVASSPPSTARTPLPIAGVGAKLGEGTVASLAPAAAADGTLAPVERGPLPRHQPTAKPAEPAPDPSGLAASPVPAPRQRPAAAPPAPTPGAAGQQAPAPTPEPAGDGDMIAAWPGRDAVTVERVVRGAAPSVSASRVAAPPAATRGAPAPTPEPAGQQAPAPTPEPAGDVIAAWPGRDAVTAERVVRGTAPSVSASRIAAPPATTRDAPAPTPEPAGDDVTAAWPGRDAVTAERPIRGAAPSVNASRVAAPPAATRDAPAPTPELAGDGDVTAAWPGRDAVTAERAIRGAAPSVRLSVNASRVAAPPAAARDAPAPSAEPAGDGDVTAAWPGRDAVTLERAIRGAAPSVRLSVNASRVAAPPATTRDAPVIEQPAPSPNEGLDALISLAVRRLAARVAGVAQPKRGGTERVPALPASWTPATDGKTQVPSAVPSAVPAAAEMEQGDTLRAGSDTSGEGMQTPADDDGARHQLRLIKFPSTSTPAPSAGAGAKLGEGTVASPVPAPLQRTAAAPPAPGAGSAGRAPAIAGGIEAPPLATADQPATAPSAPPPSGGAAPSLNASRVAAPPAATRDAPAIEQPAPSPNEERNTLIDFAVRRLAARVAGVAQPKRGGAEGTAAAAEMAEGDTLLAGSEAFVEGTQTWVGDVGSRHQLRLIKFPSMRSRLGLPTSPAPADATGAGEGGAPASGRPSPIRRTTRSGELRVEAPRSAMTPAPSAPLAPVPASAMSVPAAPALAGTASLTEPASPVALVASEPLAPPPVPADRVTLRIGGEDGDATRVWVSVRGDTVHTRIATADAPAAAALTAALGELHSALERQGFTDGSLRVLVPSPGPNDGRTAPPAAQAAANAAAATTPSRGTDAPSDGNLPGKQRGQDTATDRPGQHGQRPHQRSPRERER